MLIMESEGKDPLAPDHLDQEILFRTPWWYVTENRYPYEGAERHFLVVATGPVYSFEGISLGMWGGLREVWRRLVDEYGVDGGALVFRFGDPARSGASLTRVHCHIIQPKEGAKVRPTIGGKLR